MSREAAKSEPLPFDLLEGHTLVRTHQGWKWIHFRVPDYVVEQNKIEEGPSDIFGTTVRRVMLALEKQKERG